MEPPLRLSIASAATAAEESTRHRPRPRPSFGAAPGSQARLTSIKAEGVDGISFTVSGEPQVAGRFEGALLFPEDPMMSPRHASFSYRDGTLIVEDLASANGVFVRLHQPATLQSGEMFVVGEQLMQVEACPPDLGPQIDAEGTSFYASPKRPSKLQLIQRLRGGDIGMVFRARNDALTMGREGNDVNFPDDPFISGHHAKIAAAEEGRFTLTDLGSKNGTFASSPHRPLWRTVTLCFWASSSYASKSASTRTQRF